MGHPLDSQPSAQLFAACDKLSADIKALHSKTDRLTEALLGLCLLASQTSREGQERLVAQFRLTYPEIVVSPDVAVLRSALDRVNKAIHSIKPGSYATLDGALDAIVDTIDDDAVYQAWKPV